MNDFYESNYAFFYEFLNIYDKFNRSHCQRINKSKNKFGPYDYEPFQARLEFYIL